MPIELGATTVSGTSYVRCRAIEILNHDGKVPRIRFALERKTTYGDGTVTYTALPDLWVDFDAAKQYNLINPETGAIIEGATMTHGELFVALFSAWYAEHFAANTPAP